MGNRTAPAVKSGGTKNKPLKGGTVNRGTSQVGQSTPKTKKLKANNPGHTHKPRTEVKQQTTKQKDFDALSAASKPRPSTPRGDKPLASNGLSNQGLDTRSHKRSSTKARPLAVKYQIDEKRKELFAPNAKARLEGAGPEWIYEDNHLLLAYKPVGMLSQGDETGEDSTLEWAAKYLKAKYNKPGDVFVAPIHRLDRPVQGLQLLARTSKAATRLTQQFQEHTVEKVYYAITEETPENEEGVLVHYLQKMPGTNIVKAYTRKKGAETKEAKLWYRVHKVVGQRALLEIRPFTGRQHQIRVQLAKMGAGIVGDKKYAPTKFLPDKSIALFAKELTFTHPTTGKRMRFELDFPQTEPWRNFLLNLD